MNYLLRPLLPTFACLVGLMAGDEGRPPQPPGEGEPRDPVEMAKHMNELKTRDPERFKKIDTDADGTISPDEAKAYGDKEREAGKARMDEMLGEAFTAADKDKDGKLDKVEFAAAAQDMGKRMREGMKNRKPRGEKGPKGKPEGKPDDGATGPDAPPAKPF